MADIIAMFSRWAKSGLLALLDGSSSSSSSVEPTRGNALDEFQRIMRMLPRIEAVLEDAEEREIQDRSVKLWLSELRCLAYDIDDVIDEYEYDVQIAQMEARAAEESYHHGKRKRGDDERYGQIEHLEGLNTLASSSYQVPAVSDGMVEKLREIRERFDEIERDRKGLRLREDDGVRRTVSAQNYRLTSSLVDESNIIGRESEKEKIVKLLLSDVQVSNKITVIPIVGMGGVGKTTLAQLIYNDPRIRQYFDLRIWIYVSEDFDLVKLTKEIYRSITNKSCEEHVGFDYLQDSIKKELMKFKRMFLVLDDVWNEKQFLWESLKVPFHNAGVVNILLTTRNEKVADVMRTMNYCRLGFLSKDEGWRLFNQYALCGDENLMRIGQKIVNKCDGLPLAIKLLGSHLQFERDEDKWMSILESELWDLDPGTNEIFPALKLSYQRMPIHLKPCFRYCSLFPKKHIPDKNCLVWLWIAQGYIQPKIRGKTMEETGREYLDELLGRSFFQATESTDYFEMHDLIYDLAVFISDNEFISMKLNGGNQNICISNNARHLAVHDEPTNNEALKDIIAFPFLSRHVALRSIFCYARRIINYFQLSDSTRLRVLHIEIDQFVSNFTKFIGSTASMKHLRYLYIHAYARRPLWEDVALSSLFNSLHSMVNVKVLDLSGVHYPIMLPASIKNFINLRHLILPDDSFMPCGISKLTCLQTLKKIVVQDGNHESGGLGEIENLASLTGSCCICNIKYANNVEDFKKANINGKKQIRRLFIDWHSTMIYSYLIPFDVCIYFEANDKVKKQSFELEEVKLEALRPHNNLKKLEIHNYPGILFPLWLGDPSYCKLQDITLQGCNEWDGSGRVLDRDLPCLRSIFILDCAMLKNIKIVQSSSLRRLLVEECPNITSLHGLCSLHRLEKLEIRGCNNLLISAEEILPSKLQFVCFKDCWELTSIPGLQNLPSLKELKLIRCPKLELTLEEKLSTIPSVLKIANCPGLEKWCQIYGFKYIQAGTYEECSSGSSDYSDYDI
ncbi:disease resistance protein RGA2-like [Dendrobium catenatum]|uniref:disease resistance protein RGA2-like n=1 Tax=Dendrobium catenatum TaxID=906689 RepID=UPI0009F63855|nr:disease resistance protein RGA2-like [Dendrobium catenatum]XP_028556866.1 disease resistance protein RGA2-like [Dendrobium catenatum]